MRTTIAAAMIGLALLGTITLAQNITYDFDRSAPFARFKTYTWIKGTPVNDALNDKRIVSAIDSQLAAKGFTKVNEGGTADVLVAYHASFDKNLQINGFSSGWGGYRFGGTRTGRATLDQVTVGTIAVDMVEEGILTPREAVLKVEPQALERASASVSAEPAISSAEPLPVRSRPSLQPVRKAGSEPVTVDLTAEDDTMALPRLDSLERKLKDLEQQFG